MNGKIYVSFLISLLLGCRYEKRQKVETYKELKIGVIKMDVPDSYKFLNGTGVDSYIAYIVNDYNDTFDIEYGKPGIIYKLFDYPPRAFSLKDKEGFLKNFNRLPSSDEAIFSKSPEEDNSQNIFQKEFYMYDTIHGIVVKIVQPKRIGDGKTGLYIPELKDGNSFTIYSKNLDSSSHRKAFKMFQTLKYKN